MRGKSFWVGGANYFFTETCSNDGRLAGLVSLRKSDGTTLLVLDFQNYAHILPDGMTLLWREIGERGAKQLSFDSFSLGLLRRIADPMQIAFEMRAKNIGVSMIHESQHWEFSPMQESGAHSLKIEHDWSRFRESLVLADHGDANGFDKMSRAIFAFDWQKRQVEVFPQDWFNDGGYDFGYQWITRVARQQDGSIVGDGIRLGSFVLDSTNRHVGRWLSVNPFFGI